MPNNAESPVLVYKPVPLTNTLHSTVYGAIDPSQPSLSQAGRTVLITGGSAGIGYAIAENFALAGADKVIITGRTRPKLDEAISRLAQDHSNCDTKFEGVVCQMSDSSSIDQMFDSFGANGIHVDVLVLNAAFNVNGTLSDQGWEKTWEQFIVNTRALHQLCERLHKQEQGKGKYYIVNVSSGAIHDSRAPKNMASYSLTKASGTLLVQKLADEKDPSQTQIASFHPGAVVTDQVREKGMTEIIVNWDDASLPGAFAVWCASDEAAFLHGRFVWSAWDVEELKSGSIRDRLDKDGQFLRIGVHGL
ncbi:peroxisomal short-chain alcohol dehydrogenase [Fusarium mundagurra]|uniref:Peroxisomal short-chain alcohol dehydrogenase n=1 Tax=Fusarium mundagurra TaxID=1567541 RepID=A0A8H6DQ06_9HYPO|nr:peroxisomal short-chain alcohol dehydrogenase [Fusarium mundagurra]